MNRVLAAGAILALGTGVAFGDTISSNGVNEASHMPASPSHLVPMSGGPEAVINVPTVNIDSWDGFFLPPATDPSNIVLNFNVATALGLPSGTACVMTGIGWNVNIETIGTNSSGCALPGSSFQSEARLYFDDNIAPDGSGLFLRPGVADAFASPNKNYSNPAIDLTDNGIPDINLPNGILRIEFNESFDDVANVVDGRWVSGSLQVVANAVPEPTSLALVGVGSLAMFRRRRA